MRALRIIFKRTRYRRVEPGHHFDSALTLRSKFKALEQAIYISCVLVQYSSVQCTSTVQYPSIPVQYSQNGGRLVSGSRPTLS